MADVLKSVSKAHVVYKTADGKRVPGATTITGLRAKPYLITWANNLGLEGIDSNKYRDAAAEIGTLAHAMIQAHIQDMTLDMSTVSPMQQDLAENAVLSYLQWEKGHKIVPIICEEPMVSEKYKFGGTVDCYCMLDGRPVLIDFKTGKAIYDEYFWQTAAYAEILREHGHPVDEVKILRVGRDASEGFEERGVSDTGKYFAAFKCLLDLYYIEKELKR